MKNPYYKDEFNGFDQDMSGFFKVALVFALVFFLMLFAMLAML